MIVITDANVIPFSVKHKVYYRGHTERERGKGKVPLKIKKF